MLLAACWLIGQSATDDPRLSPPIIDALFRSAGRPLQRRRPDSALYLAEGEEVSIQAVTRGSDVYQITATRMWRLDHHLQPRSLACWASSQHSAATWKSFLDYSILQDRSIYLLEDDKLQQAKKFLKTFEDEGKALKRTYPSAKWLPVASWNSFEGAPNVDEKQQVEGLQGRDIQFLAHCWGWTVEPAGYGGFRISQLQVRVLSLQDSQPYISLETEFKMQSHTRARFIEDVNRKASRYTLLNSAARSSVVVAARRPILGPFQVGSFKALVLQFARDVEDLQKKAELAKHNRE